MRSEQEIKKKDVADIIREGCWRLTYGNIMMLEEYKRWVLGEMKTKEELSVGGKGTQ